MQGFGSNPTSGQFHEELLVQCLVLIRRSHGEEYVAADELVDNLTVCAVAGELNLLLLHLDHHLLHLPVHVPRGHGAVPPGLLRISRVDVKLDQSVMCYSKQFLQIEEQNIEQKNLRKEGSQNHYKQVYSFSNNVVEDSAVSPHPLKFRSL